VDRLACADLPAFPLQILLIGKPDWASFPVVVVDEDRPQGTILWANERARQGGVLPGFRYAHALSLCRELRADVVPESVIRARLEDITELLRTLSPDVESSHDEPGTFWLSGTGMRSLYASASAWGRAIAGALAGAGWQARVAVGFTRFGSYAVTKLGRALVVLRDIGAEQRAAREVPLDRIGIEPALRDLLAKLGIHTLGGYVGLPAGGLLLRFGAAAARLHALAQGQAWNPLRPQAAELPLEERIILDDPETDATRLLFAMKGAVATLLLGLAERAQAAAALLVAFELDHKQQQNELLKPAEATLDDRTLLRLLHLRLEASPPRAGVREIRLGVVGVPAQAEQLTLFREGARRDLRAGSQALAQLRAELGEGAVRRAVLRDGHLPETQFGWAPQDRVVAPRAQAGRARVLVRRIHSRPLEIPPHRSAVHDDGWLISGLEYGAVLKMHGPFVMSGGWWLGDAAHAFVRQYAFADMRRGDCLWLYYDRVRRRWFIQGAVE
jgi:protein ImuB